MPDKDLAPVTCCAQQRFRSDPPAGIKPQASPVLWISRKLCQRHPQRCPASLGIVDRSLPGRVTALKAARGPARPPQALRHPSPSPCACHRVWVPLPTGLQVPWSPGGAFVPQP